MADRKRKTPGLLLRAERADGSADRVFLPTLSLMCLPDLPILPVFSVNAYGEPVGKLYPLVRDGLVRLVVVGVRGAVLATRTRRRRESYAAAVQLDG